MPHKPAQLLKIGINISYRYAHFLEQKAANMGKSFPNFTKGLCIYICGVFEFSTVYIMRLERGIKQNSELSQRTDRDIAIGLENFVFKKYACCRSEGIVSSVIFTTECSVKELGISTLSIKCRL